MLVTVNAFTERLLKTVCIAATSKRYSGHPRGCLVPKFFIPMNRTELYPAFYVTVLPYVFGPLHAFVSRNPPSHLRPQFLQACSQYIHHTSAPRCRCLERRLLVRLQPPGPLHAISPHESWLYTRVGHGSRTARHWYLPSVYSLEDVNDEANAGFKSVAFYPKTVQSRCLPGLRPYRCNLLAAIGCLIGDGPALLAGTLRTW